MQLSRRGVVAAAVTTLAGCGRAFRENEVPGGLVLRNRDDTSRSVGVLVWSLDRTATPTEAPTPPDGGPAVRRRFDLEPREKRPVPNFFPDGGWWLVRAVAGDATAELTIRLYDAAPGPAGADTVFVTVRNGTPSLRASHVDD